jgi:general stress protein 26
MLPSDATGLIERARVARIATVSSNGRPHVNPLWYMVDDGRIVLGTSLHTLAARNAAANERVQVLFEDESSPDDERELRVDGTATVRTDPALLKRYRRAIARRYMMTPRGLVNLLRHARQWPAFRRHVSSGESCVIEVEPTGYTWMARRPD